MNYPFNVRSFFTNREAKDIGGGIQLWRGYFQSVRPGISQMFINIDISTATMYKPGPLLNLMLEFTNRNHPNQLGKAHLSDREFLKLQRFFSGVRIVTTQKGAAGQLVKTPRVVKRLNSTPARDFRFELREGGQLSVADYFRKQGQPLKFPDLGCVEVGLVISM